MLDIWTTFLIWDSKRSESNKTPRYLAAGLMLVTNGPRVRPNVEPRSTTQVMGAAEEE